MTEGAVGPVQGVNVSGARQSTVARLAKNRGVAGVAVAAQTVDHPVVVSRFSCVFHSPILMAGIAGSVGNPSNRGDFGRDCFGTGTVT